MMDDFSNLKIEINDVEAMEILESVGILNNSCHVISGSGWGWYLDPDVNEMVRIARGTEIIPVSNESDEKDRILVRAPFRFILIEEKEVEEVGWN